MNRQAVLKRLQQLEQSRDPVQLCFVHELVQADEVTEVRYIGTTTRGHHLWEVPALDKDEFGRVLDSRFDAALAEHFKPQGPVTPLHIIGTTE